MKETVTSAQSPTSHNAEINPPKSPFEQHSEKEKKESDKKVDTLYKLRLTV